MRRALVFAVLFWRAATAQSPLTAVPIRFEEIAQRAGLIFTTESSPTSNKNQPETMAGGVGVLDYDNDDYPHIFLVNGAAIPSLQKDDPKYKNRLFHSNGDMTFTDVTDKGRAPGCCYVVGVA